MEISNTPRDLIWRQSEDDEKRADSIIPNLNKPKRIIDVACGEGKTLIRIKEAFPECECIGVDIVEFPQWKESKVKFVKSSLQDFIKKDIECDAVLMLNSFRNWEGDHKDKFVDWLKRNSYYFFTSTNLPYNKKVIGKDIKNIDLEMYELFRDSTYSSDSTDGK